MALLLPLLLAASTAPTKLAAQGPAPDQSVLRVCNGTCPSTLQGGFGEALTFTRASAFTCPNNDGTVYQLQSGYSCQPYAVGPGPTTNLCQQSGNLTGSPWTRDNVTATLTAGGPGGASWNTLTDNSTNAQHRAYQAITTPVNANYTWSTYCGAGTLNFLTVYDGSLNGATFNCSTCASLGTLGVATASTATTTDYGGVCRVSFTALSAAAAQFLELRIGDTLAHSQGTYSGTGTGTLNVWGAQLEQAVVASAPTPLVQTAAAVAMGNFRGYGYRSRLAVTNIAQFYNAFGTAPWSTASDTSPPTITNNTSDVTSPDGSNSATKLAWPDTTALTTAQFSIVYQSPTLTAANYVGSMWLRTLSGTATLYLVLNQGATWFSTTANVTTTWTRFVVNGTATAVAWDFQIGIDRRATGNPAGQPAQTVYAWGAQLETPGIDTTFASDICATAGASATCNGEFAQFASATPGLTTTFCVSADSSGQWGSGSVRGPFGSGVGVSANTWHAYQQSNQWFWDAYDNSGTLKEWSVAQTLSPGTQHHIRFCFDGSVGSTPLLIVDGSSLAFGAPTGAGTGVLANNNGLVLVGSAHSNVGQLIGSVSNVCLGNCTSGALSSCAVCP